MLFAFETAAEAFWAVAGVVITAMFSGAVWMFNAWREQRRKDVSTALDEWKEYAGKVETRLSAAEREHTRCMKENAEMKGDLKLLQFQFRDMQAKSGVYLQPATVLPGIIVADFRGIIRVFSPALTPILHYLPAELVGKSIETLVPDRLKLAHRAGWQRAVDSGIMPDASRPIITHALAKEGHEVPVIIHLTGWKTDRGDGILTAEIKARATPDGPEAGAIVRGHS